MGSFHFFRKSKDSYNFHNDESLHDNTTEDPRPWYSNLAGDAYAVIKNLPVYQKQGKEQYAKYIAAGLELEDPLSKVISKKLVSLLWGSLIHPPTNYRGNEFRYRTADGSNNSVLYPHLGKSGLPYAKSVPTKRATQGALPDPGDLFDLLMAREDEGNVSDSGISMMLLYHATVIIHDIFRTDDYDANISATSSYLDLAPLYGSDIDTQRSVRQMRDGLLKIDTFAETRLLNQPPGVCIYIIMYNRFHNYVAKQLREINEHGRFSLPPGCDGSEEARKDPQWAQAFEQQDEHLFQTARLVTCGMYINVAIHDYLKCLMGVHTLDTPWTLDPRKALPGTDDARGLSRGEGNMVSAEFNLLYRFHSPISRRDAKWSEELFVWFLKDQIDDRDTAEAQKDRDDGKKYTTEQIKNGEYPTDKFKAKLDAIRALAAKRKPSADVFPAGLDVVGATGMQDVYRFKRNKDGYFDDAQLAAEMCRAMEDPICNFGAQQVPKVFRAIEVMGILQARKWEIATLNEYREFFGMSRFKSFDEINTSTEIQDRLRYLYEDPDLIEFYPGLFMEGQARNLDPGVAMPNGAASSLWRGVFSDAVTLVRSDRFYTLDWNVGSLTAWGMNEVTSHPKVNKGSVLHRLFERALPGCFEYNSVHMWQPFYTPAMNLVLAKEQGYLNFLDLTGLETNAGKPHAFVKGKNETYYGKERQRFTSWKKIIDKEGVRRTLKVYPGKTTEWRGAEYVEISPMPSEITSYKTIREEILGGPNSKNWVSQVILEPTDIPCGTLRDLMTKTWTGMPAAVEIVHKTLPSDWEQVFMDYFVGLAQDIRLRESRPLQKKKSKAGTKSVDTQVWQLDIVKDLAIPVVTRFLADLIGFWDQVKTKDYPKRKFDENQIYQDLENCQNFETFDADPTKAWERRMAYQQSIKVLKKLAEHGTSQYKRGWFENVLWSRSNGGSGDGQHIRDLRRIGVSLTQALLRRFDRETVAAFMLHTALEAAQRFVLVFAEVVAWFIDPTTRDNHSVENDEQTKMWKAFKDLAWEDTIDVGEMIGQKTAPKGGHNDPEVSAQLQRYILEAARISNPLDIVRVYQPGDKSKAATTIVVSPQSGRQEIKSGDVVLLNLREAYNDPASGLDNPESFQLRPFSSYLSYGPTASTTIPGGIDAPAFSKRAAIIGLTGLIKHCAHLDLMRVAHDKGGRLKRVVTPEGIHRYATTKWDRLVAFPTTWNVRYDGIGTGTFVGSDNADQGHGQGLLWDYESLIFHSESKEEVAKNKKAADALAIEKAKPQNIETSKTPSKVEVTSVAANAA